MRRLTPTALALSLSLSCPAPASAGWPARWCRPQPRQTAYVPARTAQPPRVVPTVTATPQTQQGDVGGFLLWLNSYRASAGLAPVAWDQSLVGWAQANNQQQQGRGIGHFVMGPARRQNSGMGPYAAVLGLWQASPAHNAALLDPSIRCVAIAGLGGYWTFSAF